MCAHLLPVYIPGDLIRKYKEREELLCGAIWSNEAFQKA